MIKMVARCGYKVLPSQKLFLVKEIPKVLVGGRIL
jgi:hypothetical protein